MDLEALCCTEERKISKTYNLQKRQGQGTESMDVGRGEERSPFQLFENTLGFWGNMNESSWWTLLSPSAEFGFCISRVG